MKRNTSTVLQIRADETLQRQLARRLLRCMPLAEARRACTANCWQGVEAELLALSGPSY